MDITAIYIYIYNISRVNIITYDMKYMLQYLEWSIVQGTQCKGEREQKTTGRLFVTNFNNLGH